MILCIYESFVVGSCYVTCLVEVLMFIDFHINANKLAWPILPHLWGKMGHGRGKLGIDQLWNLDD